MSNESVDFEFQLKAQQEFGVASAAAQQPQTATYTDPTDGTVYEWVAEKRGWFPKIDENFIASYQAAYGAETPATETPVEPPNQPKQPPPIQETPEVDKSLEGPSEKKKKPNDKEPPSWFDIDDERNHNVYVSGLPTDITLEEFSELMSKYGIIMENEDGGPKLKLYKDPDGYLKGDGLCCYLKVESVQLAIQLLHESTYKDKKISVEKAHFQMKGTYDPSLKKKKKNIKKKGNKQQKMLDWRERKSGDQPVRTKFDKIIIFKKLFDPKEFEEDPTLITDIKADLQEECGKFGTVKKIMVFDRHPDGVVSLAFKEFEAADLCVSKMNNRWYGGRQLEVSHWDGVTNYQIEETDKEREERLKNWESFLEGNTEEKT